MDDFEIAERFKRKFFWTVFKALDFNRITGDYAEFGSHGARTFRLAATEIDRRPNIKRHMWAFDSFQGLPPPIDDRDHHPIWTPGAMNTQREEFIALVREHGLSEERYTTVEGYYYDTLKKTDIEFPSDIALAYIDCDLFSSTMDVLNFLKPRLKHGMVLAFDDYFCWSDTHISGERGAFQEFREEVPEFNFMRYRDYGWTGTSYVVERRSL